MFVLDSSEPLPCQREDVDPEVFFEEGKTERSRKRQKYAKYLCGQCPARLICLEQALEYERLSGEVLHGIHGGRTLEERKRSTFRRIDGGSIHRGTGESVQLQAVIA